MACGCWSGAAGGTQSARYRGPTAELPGVGAVREGAEGAARVLHEQVAEYFADADVARALEAEGPEGVTVVDAGANVGLFALEAARLAHAKGKGGGATVLCFEAVPDIRADLAVNVAELAAPGATIKVLPYGLGDKEEVVRFKHRVMAPAASGRADKAHESGLDVDKLVDKVKRKELPDAVQQKVPAWLAKAPRWVVRLAVKWRARQRERAVDVMCRVRRLSDVLREERVDRVDLLKIDVEGAELDVLLGIDAEDWAKVRCAVLEVHDVDGRLAAVEGLLRARGLAGVRRSQEAVFEGTDVYTVVATRR